MTDAHTIDDERYEIIRKLGEGGLGVVYEAQDKERGIRVALKTLRRASQDATFRLKQEFRRISGFQHPNLVNLYDLHVKPDSSFFTMELVPGTDLLSYVREGVVDHNADTLELSEPAEASGLDLTLQDGLPESYNEDRLRAAMAQLATGIHALHGFGKIHRDIKPSNVRVTPDGLVKILDFGLATKFSESSIDSSSQGGIVGTLSYMSPEQASAEPRLGPATDWYALGVMLYEAISGALPFTGRPVQILAQKTQEDPPSVRVKSPSAPADLSELCDALLQREPADRLLGRAILEHVGAVEHSRGQVNTPLPSLSRSEEILFVGREKERAQIHSALARVQATRRAQTVVVSGPSGIGKSSLVDRVFQEAQAEYEDLIVLRGRCYEWETVSYKAMDGVIDDLSSHWMSLEREDAARLLPRDASLLSVIFPVLGRVRAVKRARSKEPLDMHQALREKAFAALRETFDRISIESPVAIYLDDMQWADENTIDLLRAILRSPKEPALLIVLSTREQGLSRGTPLSSLLEDLPGVSETVAITELRPEEAKRAARSILGPDVPDLVERTAIEAAGNPFFLAELAYYFKHDSNRAHAEGGVDKLIQSRVAGLPDEEKRLLELLCIAGSPIGGRVAQGAAGLSAASVATATKSLRHQNLLRSTGGRETEGIAPYHDRVRIAVSALLTKDNTNHAHQSLAQTLEQEAPEQPERIVRHWLQAGQASKSVPWSRRAAEQALAKLEFGDAAEFYEMALVHGDFDGEERLDLLMAQASALGEAGRPKAAAEAYGLAQEERGGKEDIELRRLITENLMFSGDIRNSLDAARELAREVGLIFPSNRATTLMHLVRNEIRLVRTDLLKQEASVKSTASVRAKIDVAASLAMGLSGADPLRSGVFTQQWAQEALRLAEPARCTRALTSLSMLSSMQNSPRRAFKLIDAAEEWAHRDGTHASDAYVSAGRAFTAFYLDNNWKRARAELDNSRQRWQDAGRGLSHEMGIVRVFNAYAASYQGDMREIVDNVPRDIESAQRTGNRFLELSLRTGFSHRYLVQDEPERAELDLRRVLADWPSQPFMWQHWFAALRRVELHLYAGRPDSAQQVLEDALSPMRQSLLMRIHIFKSEYDQAEARAQIALALGSQGRQRQRLLKQARATASGLAKSKRDLPLAWSHLLHASLAHLDQDPDKARQRLKRACHLFEKTGTELYHRAAQRRLGQLTRGEKGQRLVAKADLWMARQGIRQPSRMSDMLVPGF